MAFAIVQFRSLPQDFHSCCFLNLSTLVFSLLSPRNPTLPLILISPFDQRRKICPTTRIHLTHSTDCATLTFLHTYSYHYRRLQRWETADFGSVVKCCNRSFLSSKLVSAASFSQKNLTSDTGNNAASVATSDR